MVKKGTERKEMGISINTRQAYSEIDEFLRLLSVEQRNKVPQKLRELFKQEKDKEYIKRIDSLIPIKEQNLKEETLAIIALLNLHYWEEDEEEKERLQKVYSKNEKIYQEMLKEKFNPDNIFKKKITKIESRQKKIQDVQMIEHKEPMIKRILNGILKFLHLK